MALEVNLEVGEREVDRPGSVEDLLDGRFESVDALVEVVGVGDQRRREDDLRFRPSPADEHAALAARGDDLRDGVVPVVDPWIVERLVGLGIGELDAPVVAAAVDVVDDVERAPRATIHSSSTDSLARTFSMTPSSYSPMAASPAAQASG
jgi:hypothetical protein